MDITKPRVWSACGWAAAALSVGVVTLCAIIAVRPTVPRVAGLLAVCMSVASAALAVVRLFAPHVAEIKQKWQLTLNMQRRVLGEFEPAPEPRRATPVLRLVPGDDTMEIPKIVMPEASARPRSELRGIVS